MKLSIRRAEKEDLEAMLAVDAVSYAENERRSELRSWVDAGSAVVADTGSIVAGFAVLEYFFFRQGFVTLLHVLPSHRRHGVGTSLLEYVEASCRTSKIFTSTNQSNTPMQRLLLSLDYEPSGIVYNLDEGDPELFYYKALGARL